MTPSLSAGPGRRSPAGPAREEHNEANDDFSPASNDRVRFRHGDTDDRHCVFDRDGRKRANGRGTAADGVGGRSCLNGDVAPAGGKRLHRNHGACHRRHRTVRYDVVVPQIEGGDPAVAAEFDESMRAALQDQIDGWPGDRFTLESTDRSAVVHIGSRVVSGLLVTSWNADPPGAHPTPLVATVVIADDAQPVTLDRLFPDLRAGLNRLSEESAELLPATAAGPDFLREGIEPKRENFANWVATPAGMEIHFTDYQVGPHAIGLIVVTVPWDGLSDVVAPDLVGVVSS